MHKLLTQCCTCNRNNGNNLNELKIRVKNKKIEKQQAFLKKMSFFRKMASLVSLIVSAIMNFLLEIYLV